MDIKNSPGMELGGHLWPTPYVVKTMSDLPPPEHREPCGHCGRTSHGFVCCGTIVEGGGTLCGRGDHPDGDPAPEPPIDATARPQHGPTSPRRPARRNDPRGNR